MGKWHALTGRELQVARVYLRTGTLAATAYELGVSVQTVKNHLRNAYRAENVQNFAQLVNRMWETERLP